MVVGSSFGKSLSNDGQRGAVSGSVSGAMHVHAMAEAYDVPVILHTDHAARKLLPWIDGMLDASENFTSVKGNLSTVHICSTFLKSP